MSDYNYNNKMEMGDGGNTTVIPTKNVIKKFLIKGFIMTIEVQVRNNNVEKVHSCFKKENTKRWHDERVTSKTIL